MFSTERWQEIFEAIAKNKLRTFLTGISVASGIFILVILLAAGKGLQNGIQKQFERDAEGLIEVWSGTTSKEYKGLNPGRNIELRNSDYNAVLQQYGDLVDKRSVSYVFWDGVVNYGKESGAYSYRGVFEDHQYIENMTIVSGRFLNASDIKNGTKVAVVGIKVKNDLLKEGNPIGKMITINNVNFKVVGVYTDPAGEREESRVYLPISTCQKAFGISDKVMFLAFTLKKEDVFEKALAKSNSFSKGVDLLLKSKNTVAPDDSGAIGVNSTVENAKQFYDLNLYIRLFFWWVGICTIIAGVVSVSNIMLIIVKERTKEIGIRKALGATPFSIVYMIMQESIFITTISGFVGLLSSLSLLELVGPQIKSEYFLNPQVDFGIALSTIFLLVIAGAFAGFFPAYRAAKIKPIVALRDE